MKAMNRKIFSGYMPKAIVAFMLAFLVSQCVSINSLEQPDGGTAGERVTIKLSTALKVEEDLPGSRLIVGFLAPTSWEVGETATVRYTSELGSGTMSPVPANATPSGESASWADALRQRFGIGDNYISDVEWVVFQTDVTANIVDDNNQTIHIDVFLEPLLGMQNLTVQLGYFVGTNKYGLGNTNNYALQFGSCFTVSDGEGQHLDYCSPQIATAEPAQSTDNDIISIYFDEMALPTALSGADQVYFCATGFTATETIDLCATGSRQAMTALGEGRWRIDFWPRQLFQLTEGQELARVEYVFTDAQGTRTVLNGGDTGEPFVYQFYCK